MTWQKGQEVSLLKETGVFVIISIEKDHLLLEDEFGFELRVLHAEAVLRRPIPLRDFQSKDEKPTKPTPQLPKDKSLPSIDLHAEMLGLPQGMQAHSILLAQLRAFKNFCNEQYRHQQNKFEVVHGAGEGVLKGEIRQLVLAKKGIQMHDGTWSNGRVGASRIEITLHQFEPF
jgi:hypothetical protein